MKKIFWVVALFIVLCLINTVGANAFVFFDDFNGSALDTSSKWNILEEDGTITIKKDSGISFLSMYGGSSSFHKRVESKVWVKYGRLESRVMLGGDYNKVGFGVNGGEDQNIYEGFFFDTLSANERENGKVLFWRIYKDESGSPYYEHHLIDNTFFDKWYTVRIDWMPGIVNFYVDGNKIGEYATSYNKPLPIRIYNDRFPEFKVDYIKYSPIPEPSTFLLLLSSLLGLFSIGLRHKK